MSHHPSDHAERTAIADAHLNGLLAFLSRIFEMNSTADIKAALSAQAGEITTLQTFVQSQNQALTSAQTTLATVQAELTALQTNPALPADLQADIDAILGEVNANTAAITALVPPAAPADGSASAAT